MFLVSSKTHVYYCIDPLEKCFKAFNIHLQMLHIFILEMSESYAKTTNLKRKKVTTKPEQKLEQKLEHKLEKRPKFYPTEPAQKKNSQNSLSLSSSSKSHEIEPGTALILLTGKHRGKR